MASTYSTGLRIELQATGENSGTWGTITNNNFSQSLEFSIAGVVSVAMGNSDTTLTNADGPQSQANNQARNAMIIATGAHSQARVLQFPATQKIYLIRNATTDAGSSGPYAITARLGASGNTLSIANGTTRLVATDGTNWFDVFSLAGSIDLQGQELILDADADTSLTADTDDQIDVKMANIDVANLTTQNSGDLVITTAVQDKDFVIKGDDGGAGITALTLDMSDAGKATFNGVVTADAGITVDNLTLDGTELDLSSGDFTLDVAGDITLDADGGDVIISDAGTAIAHFTNSSSDFVIESKVADKDILIKGLDDSSVITACTFDMSAAGKATFNDDVVAFSDERLKSNIETIPNALDKVLQMRGVNFDKNGHKSMGVIAQEVEKIIPEVVSTENKDGEEYLGVAYPNMVGILIEAIKDLQKQVDELKKG